MMEYISCYTYRSVQVHKIDEPTIEQVAEAIHNLQFPGEFQFLMSYDRKVRMVFIYTEQDRVMVHINVSDKFGVATLIDTQYPDRNKNIYINGLLDSDYTRTYRTVTKAVAVDMISHYMKVGKLPAGLEWDGIVAILDDLVETPSKDEKSDENSGK